MAFLAEYKGMGTRVLADTFYFREREQAVRHLFVVASSLDSMILGESQILWQVKRAYEIARRRSCTGAYTHGAFQAAIRTARRIANETSLYRHRISIPRLAVNDCARQVFEKLHDKLVVVVGAGEMATETLRALQVEGARNIVVLNRQTEKARKLADQFRAQAWSWDDLPRAFAQADLIITATSAQSPIVPVEDFRRWESARQQRTLLILDLGVPRDVDPQVGKRLGVFLYSIDDLRGLGERNRQRREKELPRAYEIVDEEATLFAERMHARAAGPLIQQLQLLNAQAQDDELRRLFGKLPDLDEESRHAIRNAMHRLAGKLMHPIVTSLRQGSASIDASNVQAASHLTRSRS
jgi:glutamyl-tRNA reductase